MTANHFTEIDAYRFWIGTAAERWSTIWKIWDKNQQVYATSSNFHGTTKLSLHSPEDCQFGYTRKFREDRGYSSRLGNFPTYIRWKRKAAVPGQAVPLVILQFPTDFLKERQPVPQKRKNKFQDFLTPAEEGRCVELLFVAVARQAISPSLVIDHGYRHIIHMPLGTDELCIVAWRHAKFDAGFVPDGQEIELPTEWLSESAKSLRPGESAMDQHFLFWSEPKDYEVFRVAEATGMTVTHNARRKVPRDPELQG